MKVRLAEQAMSSLATFLLSVVALRLLEPADIAQFFIATAGCQVAFSVLAARIVTPAANAQRPLTYSRECLWTLIRVAAVFAVPVAALTSVFTHRFSAEPSAAIVHFGVVYAYCAAHLTFEVFRRATAVLAGGSGRGASMLAQAARLALPGVLVGVHATSAMRVGPFFLICSAFLSGAAAVLAHSLVQSDGDVTFSEHLATIRSGGLGWYASSAEALTSVSWANVPLLLLANISGNEAVAVLGAARTPISFFNVALEFIEVHLRRHSFSSKLKGSRRLQLALATGGVLVSSVLLYAYGPFVLELVSGRQYAGARLELALFWVLQFAVLADKVTFNEQRRTSPSSLSLTASLGVVAICSVLTICLVSIASTAGSIAAMILWCCANVAARRGSICRARPHPSAQRNMLELE